jgi:hypothetical protein
MNDTDINHIIASFLGILFGLALMQFVSDIQSIYNWIKTKRRKKNEN